MVAAQDREIHKACNPNTNRAVFCLFVCLFVCYFSIVAFGDMLKVLRFVAPSTNGHD